MKIVISSEGNEYSYNSDIPEEEEQAFCKAFGITPDQYKEIKKKNDKYLENFEEKFPLLTNIRLDEEYKHYVDLADFE